MIYVVTAVHDRYKITEAFVKNLLRQSCKDLRLVLVDDGCTDGTADMVRSLMSDAVILEGDGDLWWGGALHMAYKWLKAQGEKGSYVLLANDDTRFEDDYIQRGIELLRQNPGTLIAGCGYSCNSGELLDATINWDFRVGDIASAVAANTEGNCASTRSLFMELEVMLAVGGFHPVLLPHYGSDYEWTIRAAKKGYSIRSFEELRYVFDEGTTGDNFIEKITLKKLFSKRSILNPVYRLSFVFLTTPLSMLPSHLGHQLKRYVKKIGYLMGKRQGAESHYD